MKLDLMTLLKVCNAITSEKSKLVKKTMEENTYFSDYNLGIGKGWDMAWKIVRDLADNLDQPETKI